MPRAALLFFHEGLWFNNIYVCPVAFYVLQNTIPDKPPICYVLAILFSIIIHGFLDVKISLAIFPKYDCGQFPVCFKSPGSCKLLAKNFVTV